jgi:hypothetical protein
VMPSSPTHDIASNQLLPSVAVPGDTIASNQLLPSVAVPGDTTTPAASTLVAVDDVHLEVEFDFSAENEAEGNKSQNSPDDAQTHAHTLTSAVLPPLVAVIEGKDRTKPPITSSTTTTATATASYCSICGEEMLPAVDFQLALATINSAITAAGGQGREQGSERTISIGDTALAQRSLSCGSGHTYCMSCWSTHATMQVSHTVSKSVQ